MMSPLAGVLADGVPLLVVPVDGCAPMMAAVAFGLLVLGALAIVVGHRPGRV